MKILQAIAMISMFASTLNAYEAMYEKTRVDKIEIKTISERTALERAPSASDPEPGSVMAQAPTFSRVNRSRAHRSFCSVVPLERMALAARPTLTPMAVTMPGQ